MTNKYVFILGNNPEISIAEIKAIYPAIKEIERTPNFLIGEIDEFNCQEAIDILGGTIKIGQVINSKIDKDQITKEIISRKGDSKVKFGFSFYGTKPSRVGMEIKKALKEADVSSRLVVSKEKTLSSVIVKKNKVIDFMVMPEHVSITCAIQNFKEYGHRDYGRPKSDAHSGMLPPKLARIMINLAKGDKQGILLDPFCGSGTVLMEAAMLGYKNLSGSDVSKKAVDDSEENLQWTIKTYDLENITSQIERGDSQKLTSKTKPESIDNIITEPYLGPSMKGGESDGEITKTITSLRHLYIKSFEEFKTILKPGGKIVIIIPSWHLKRDFELGIEKEISGIGFKRLDKNNLLYKREGQKIWRNIQIWQK